VDSGAPTQKLDLVSSRNLVSRKNAEIMKKKIRVIVKGVLFCRKANLTA